MNRFFVVRINYENQFKLIRNELLNNNVLRQGWGSYGMAVDAGYDSFKAAWRADWGDSDPDERIRSIYKALIILLEIEPGDYIIVPKVSTHKDYPCQSFVVARCKAKYRFDVLEKAKDFGHIIEVENVFSCVYEKNMDAQTVSGKIGTYQYPVNRVWNSSFINAVANLIRLHTEKPEEFEKNSASFLSMIGTATTEPRIQYLNQVKSSLQKMNNHRFEDLICELFVKCGYSLVRKNWYDKEGGDVDLIFECFSKNTLMHNVFEIWGTEMPFIYVQAKKKTGKDSGDVIGVDQLIKMEKRIKDRSSIKIVINLTDEFSPEAKTIAERKNIILINGLAFSSLLVKYGIDADI